MPSADVYIRPLQLEDSLVSWRWRNDPEIWALTGSRPDRTITPEIEQDWITRVIAEQSSYRYAICLVDDDRYIGNVQLTSVTEDSAEFHIFLGEKDCWNRGLGTQATEQMVDLARSQFRLKRLYLTVNRENTAALRIYERLGFQWQGDQMVKELL